MWKWFNDTLKNFATPAQSGNKWMYTGDIPFTNFSPEWLRGFPVPLVNKYAKQFNIDARLLGAVVQTESGGNPFAVRFEPSYRYTSAIASLANEIGCSYSSMEMMQKTSWGLMQVMGSTAYDLGLGREKNKWPSTLLDPEMGMKYGCTFLKRKIDQYGALPEVVYSAYNGGTPQQSVIGVFNNQDMVDNFLKNYRSLGGDL